MKTSIKREQSQAGLSFAERENRRSLAGGESNFRPQVKNKLLLLLALLMTAATGAWADGYNVTFGGFAESEMNTTVNVTSLPYTFTAIGHDALYPWTVISTSGNIFYNATVTSGGEGKVSANITYSDEMTITITGPFEGTATIHVTGEDDENRSISTDITVTCVAVGGASSGDSGDQTYSVTMKDGVKDADKWTVKVGEGQAQALPIGGLKGDGSETVTLQYNGRLKVKGVKATSDAGAPAAPASLIANPVVGQIIGSDGKNYDANATLPTGVTAVAKICYVGSETGEAAPYNHGLALALSDANDGDPCTWNTSNTDAGHTKQANYIFTEESGLQYNDTHNSDTYPAFQAAIANNGTAAPTGCSSWFLPSGYQWKKMIGAAGLDNLGLTWGGYYWSSSENDANQAWDFDCYEGIWYNSAKSVGDQVRACLAF